ncbi:MAG: PqqD family peptide modification chaperone [Clostridiales bacterium]
MLTVNQMAVFREEFDNNSLLFDPVTGKAFYLNPVATFIWKHLCLKRSSDEIEIGVKSEFSNTPLNLKSDLDDFLRSLIDNGFLGNEV